MTRTDAETMPSDRVLHVMRHATAWPKHYRNHFNADEGHHDWDALTEACDAGLMQRMPPRDWIPGFIFTVTDKGVEALIAADKAATRKALDPSAMVDYLRAADENLRLAREIRDRCAEPEVVAELVEQQVQQLTVIRFAAAELGKGE